MNPPVSAPIGPHQRGLLIAVVVLAALLPYLNSLDVPWHFDDHRAILQNPRVVGPLDWTQLLRHEYRPLLQLSFALNHAVGGLNLFGYHLVNVALHAANAVLLLLLALELGRGASAAAPSRVDWQWAALAGALFAAHPLHTESVTYISARSESLAALFYLGALLIGLRGLCAEPDRGRLLATFGAVLGLQLLALASKESAVTLLPALALALWLFSPGALGVLLRRREVQALSAAALLVLLVWGAVRAREYWSFGLPLAALDYLKTQVVCALIYARKLALPIGLNLDPDVRLVRSLFDPRFLIAFGACGLALIGLWRWRRSEPLTSFAGGWFFLALLPPALIPLKDVLAEHRAYLPGLAWTLLGVALLRRITRLQPSGPAVWSLVLLFAFGSWNRNRDYQSELRLWSDTVAKSPLKARPQMNLGVAQLRAGDRTQAEAEFQAALRLDANDVDTLVNLGLLRWQNGAKDSALELIRRALELRPDSARALATLGAMQLSLGQTEAARRSYQQARRFDPAQPQALRGLAVLAERRGDPARALRWWITLSQIQPLDPEPLRNCSRLALRAGDLSDAETCVNGWLALRPNSRQARALQAELRARSTGSEN